MIKIVKYVFYIALLVQVSTSVNAESQWISKKTNKATEIEKIEKMYADGSITKAECIKIKSNILKLPSVSKTICNNVINKAEAIAAAETAVETAVKQTEAKKSQRRKKIAKMLDLPEKEREKKSDRLR